MKKYFPILLIVVIAALLRFTYLDRIPGAMSGDELLYALTAKSVSITGSDISGTWNPLSIAVFRYPPGQQQAELPYILHLLTASLPFSLIAAKLPFAMLSVGIVLLLYLIAQELFGKPIAIATGLVAATNPWLVVMGRTGYESTPATFFYLMGLYMLLKYRAWKILWSFIPFMFGFYSYIATKTILIPLVAVAALYAYFRNKKYAKQYLVLFLICVLFIVGYIVLLKTSPTGSRIGDLVLPSSPTITSQVNEMRKDSLQVGILHLVVNKYTVYAQTILSKFFRIFSPTYLFVEGDQFFLPVRQSFFHYIDFFLIGLGLIFLFAQKRMLTVSLIILTFIGAIPHLLHKTMGDFSGHLALMFPFMILFVGAGISETILNAPKRFRIITIVIISVLYLLNVGNFVFNYYYKYPLVGSSDFPLRILSRYLSLTTESGTPVTIYSNRSGDLFRNYLFYSNGMNRETMRGISKINTRLPFVFNNVSFTDCDEGVKTAAPPVITIYDMTCTMQIQGTRIHISNLLDGGKLYAIYNDTECSKYSLKSYPSGIRISDFSVKNLTKKQFCETFIVR